MSRRLEIQLCSVETYSDVACEKVKGEYLNGNYTQLRKVSTQNKIKRVVAIQVEQDQIVETEVVEWKPSHIPLSELVSEYREVCEEIAIERQHSTVTPRLQSKLHRLEELILQRV